jgi:hypothetical protein
VEVQAALWVCRLGAGKHNLGLLYYYWGVFAFLKRWVYIDLDRMSFFKRCAIRRLKTGFQLLTGTKLFFINTKIPRPLTTVKPRLKHGLWTSLC